MASKKVIFTIGHSTRTTKEFIKILKAFEIEALVDIRHYPGSRYCPQFGKARLRANLLRNNIEYVHLESLGGRRKAEKNSELNAGWRSLQFRGYADYMQTNEFKMGLKELNTLTKEFKVAIMCSEALPWSCHRSLVGDALLVRGFKVFDLFSTKISRPHIMTAFAEVHGKKVIYPKDAS